VSDPAGEDASPHRPEEEVEVDSFGDVTELEAHGPAGSGVRVKGRGSPVFLTRLAYPPAFALVGLAGAVAVLVAGRPFWQAAAVFVAGILLALAVRGLRAPPPR
jgi:hypothetical protein